MGTVYAKESTTSALHVLSGDGHRETTIDLRTVKARVERVHVDGLIRTKDDIVRDCISELFRSQSMDDVLSLTREVMKRLNGLKCFKHVSVLVDTSKSPHANPIEGVEVTFNVKELRRLTGNVATHVDNNEGSVQLTITAPNLCGRGEELRADYTHGSSSSTAFTFAFTKMFRGRLKPVLNASVFRNHAEFFTSGYKEQQNGVRLGFLFNSLPQLQHRLEWEAAMREIGLLSKTTTNFEVREHCGVNLKSCLRHVISYDTRRGRDHIFPLGGALLQVTSEAAGLGGDIGYARNEIYMQANISPFSTPAQSNFLDAILVQLVFNSGHVSPLSNDLKISLSDRCYVGGPLSVRGFESRGVGPLTGSQYFWAIGMHALMPMPFLRYTPGSFVDLFRTHLFVTAGNVADQYDFRRFLHDRARLSAGMGVAMRLGETVRLEVNYCWPLQQEKGDRAREGIQFGIGMQFL